LKLAGLARKAFYSQSRLIALKVMAERRLNTNHAALVLTITRRIGASLRNYRDKGAVRSIKVRANSEAIRGEAPNGLHGVSQMRIPEEVAHHSDLISLGVPR
jgi:hypothetical protein